MTDFHQARDRAADAVATMRRILGAAEGRSLTTAQQRDYDAAADAFADNAAEVLGEQGSLDYFMSRYRSLEAMEHALRDTLSPSERAAAGDRARRGHESVLGGATAGDSDRRALADAYGEAAQGRSASFVSSISPAFRAESRAVGVSASLVPQSFADFVTTYERTATPMLDPGIVRVLSVPTGRSITLPRVTADASGGGTVVAEFGTIGTADPVISSATLDPFKFGVLNYWSSELDLDSSFSIMDLMAQTSGRDLGIQIGALLTLGTGTTQPYGVVNRAGTAVTALGTAQTGGESYFGWPDLLRLMTAVPAPYRSSGVFMCSSDAFTKILSFRDSSGAPIVTPGLAGAPSAIWGRPLVENPAMAAVGSASKSVIFGDMSRYVVARVNPVRVEMSREVRWTTDEVGLRVVERIDGDLIDVRAVAALTSANT